MSRYTSKHTGSEIDSAIDRAKAGGTIDTLLAGKAPAGYGLGGSAKYLTADDDLNNIWQAGWYAWDAPPKNVPTIPAIGMNGYYCSMLVMNKGGSYTFEQIVVSIDGFVFFRNVVGSASEEWDILNPPMYAGVEFRTTERYLGKLVYAKARTYAFESSYDSASQFELEIPHEISNFGSLVRAEAVNPPYMIPYVSKNGGFAGVRAVNATNILFDSYKTSWNSGDKITFKLFYTKS